MYLDLDYIEKDHRKVIGRKRDKLCLGVGEGSLATGFKVRR